MEILFTHQSNIRLFSMVRNPQTLRYSFNPGVFIWLAFLLFFACTSRKKPESEDKLKAMMTSFFTVAAQPTAPIAGLWAAESASVAALIEKKYLGGYVAKPDEMQSAEIRERLKSLHVFFRIEAGDLAMLSIVADSYGISPGRLKKRSGGRPDIQVYDAQMRGKQGSTTKAIVRYRKIDGMEKLEYEENGLVMTAVREKRAASDLVVFYSQQVKAGTGLTQY